MVAHRSTHGRTDIPLTRHGREQAQQLATGLAQRSFDLVFTSPLSRASETCRLAGFEGRAEARDELLEWDYGAYEGKRTVDIRETHRGWTLWFDGVPEGETAAEVAARIDNLLAELRAADGDSLLFGHGHVLRVLAARWLGLDATAGRFFALDPATLSVLGYERETSVVFGRNSGSSERRTIRCLGRSLRSRTRVRERALA
jgi:broad specificity phosphatase PhoE